MKISNIPYAQSLAEDLRKQLHLLDEINNIEVEGLADGFYAIPSAVLQYVSQKRAAKYLAVLLTENIARTKDKLSELGIEVE